ncbi:MAG: hypothetical protein A3H17_01090 [Candidatus Levybacteria bacterium RIFCSPLOWO2_12_FULL_37_14]|nr:MAG: Conserved TM helix repeat-containing protein [Candidatus Levybacteria bacterium GW2011_GWA1_37_16]KKQ42484.1 MAG: Conserved TM helix repeat-containing protein [Candidatus Levybacteria bacterium GW2011_GWB1_37_8]OGH50131.1 MAG: hypothetical protein A3H17_01090 [Candidatus Levybacteria bacterium RIFCSPLOWO2_12_FULL_37_14]
MAQDIGQTLLASLNNGLAVVVSYLPKIIAGTIVLLIGIIIASILKQVVLGIFKALKIESLLRKYGVPEAKQEFVWSNIFSEIVRWFVIIIFLLPTTDIWGLPRVVTILNEFLLYLPNVFVAAIIAVVGFVLGSLAHDLILASVKGVSSSTANGIASVARWAVNVFVILAVLNQLGVATDLIRILFTGFVVMLAIAGGIAFGLGGQNSARDAVEELRKKLK